MNDWRSLLKADATDWLLEKDNPSVRYSTLVDIMDVPVDEPEAAEARRAIMKTGTVPMILAKQGAKGHWGRPEDFYERSKYKGTVWQLVILAELGSDGSDDRIRMACEFILNISQDRNSGGFSIDGLPGYGGNHSKVIPCLTGNMVWSLARLGYLGDRRWQRGVDWITSYQRFDDRVAHPPAGWPYDTSFRCWGRHTCSMGAIKALKALAMLPEAARSSAVKETLDRGADYFLLHHVHKRSHNPVKVCKPRWLQLGFPLMYQTDVLEILGILAGLGYHDQRMQEAVDLILSKQDERGRWSLESTFNGRFLVNIEQKGKPSKWITLKAIKALKDYVHSDSTSTNPGGRSGNSAHTTT